MQQSVRQNTKTALIRSAERLIAEKGLGGVSVKEITNRAGAKNPSAVHYHFGNIETLIKEVFVQRFSRIEAERVARLGRVEKSAKATYLIELLEAAISPLLETCQEEEGRLYVRFCVQMLTDPRFTLDELVAEFGANSVTKLRQEVVTCLGHIPEDTLTRRLRQGFMISLLQADDYSRRIEDGSAPHVDQVIRESATGLAGYLSASVA